MAPSEWTDEQHGARLARLEQRVGDLQAVDEAGALLPDVQRRHVRQPQLVLQDAAAAGEVVVGGHRGEHDVIDLLLGHARVLERLPGRAGAQVAGGGPLLDVVARLHAAPLADPPVGGVHHPGELVVGDEVLAGDEAAAEDLGAHGEPPGAIADVAGTRVADALAAVAPRCGTRGPPTVAAPEAALRLRSAAWPARTIRPPRTPPRRSTSRAESRPRASRRRRPRCPRARAAARPRATRRAARSPC